MQRRKKTGMLIPLFAGAFFLCLFIPRTSSSDRGMIPFKPTVKIFEPVQDAAIAWNGKDEILLLATDLRTSEPTKVLEVLPLPSEPEVEKGSDLFFTVASNVILEKLETQQYKKKKNGKGLRGAEADASNLPAGKVTFHEQIGSHDISVTEVLDQEGFIEWVTAYLEGQGVDTPEIPDPMKKTIAVYLKKKYRWFVFDVVSLETGVKRHDAILYKFKSKNLYYPLNVMNTIEGDTSIRLLILSNKLLKNFKGLAGKKVKVENKAVTANGQDFNAAAKRVFAALDKLPPGKAPFADEKSRSEEVKSLNKCMARIFGILGGGEKKIKLRVWRIEAPASSFKKDLIVN
jgi:hypothetical protein